VKKGVHPIPFEIIPTNLKKYSTIRTKASEMHRDLDINKGLTHSLINKWTGPISIAFFGPNPLTTCIISEVVHKYFSQKKYTNMEYILLAENFGHWFPRQWRAPIKTHAVGKFIYSLFFSFFRRPLALFFFKLFIRTTKPQ
jgi:hypothetical protein